MREELRGLVKAKALTVTICVVLLIASLSYVGLLIMKGSPPIIAQVVHGPLEAVLALATAATFGITGYFAARGPLRWALILSGAWLLVLYAIEVPLLPGRTVAGTIALSVSALTVTILISALRSNSSD
jgi:hypothetical protein